MSGSLLMLLRLSSFLFKAVQSIGKSRIKIIKAIWLEEFL